MLVQAKMNADQLNADREKVQIEVSQKREQALLRLKTESDEATRKREHLFLENELKRRKMLLDANTALNQEKIKADSTKEMASLEAFERRELEFQQLQEKEKERAIDAHQKLREMATEELKERVLLERELAKQQQQNIILQKQNEIDCLNTEADKKLFQQMFENAEKLAALQREKEFQKEKNSETKTKGVCPSTVVVSQPEIVVAESTDSDTTPPPSQIRKRVGRRIVDDTEHLVVVQELSTSDAMCTSSQHIGISQVTGPCVGMATGKEPAAAQAPAYANPADLGCPSTMADPGLRQVVHTGATQLVNPVPIPETNLGLLSSQPLGNLSHQPALAQAATISTLPLSTQFIAPPSAMTSTTPPVFTQFTQPLTQTLPQSHVSMTATMAHPGVSVQPTFVALGTFQPYVPPPIDAKIVSLSGATFSVDLVRQRNETLQTPGVGVSLPVVATAPTVIIKQPEPVRPYNGSTSFKAYREYFGRVAACNAWSTDQEKARHILVAMDGAASEAVRGLKAGKDSNLAQIWDALARRFGFLDEPERAMRRFDVRKQQDGESLAVFEQSLRILFREAWPKTDIKSWDSDSLLRRRFVDGVADLELQKYLRIHAASDDFASTVSKARHFMDASELSRIPKKPAIRGASPSVNFQTIIDGVKEVVETALNDRGCQAEVHNCQVSN